MEEKQFKPGDTVYYVRGVNPNIGQIFDRVGVVILVVEKVKYDTKGKMYGYKTTTNELMFRDGVFATLEEAKQKAKLQMETSPKDSKYYKNKDEEIFVINQAKEYKRPIEQLSLF